MPENGQRRRMRHVTFMPDMRCFKPCGKPGRGLQTVYLGHDEVEALRLADFEGLYQEACAERMKISRSTFSRIVQSARKKVADALLHGKIMQIKEEHENCHHDQ